MLAAHNIAPYSSFAHSHKASSSAFVLTGSPKGSSERWAWHTSTTRYHAPSFERTVTSGQTVDYTYIESPNGLVAAIKTAGSQHDVMLLAADHLGSIIGVWSSSGTLLEEHRYTAWGLRTSSTASPRLRRGFTGHEHLPQFGLIDMQARLYDPHLGRFLAPDPYVQAPDNHLSLNRYAYCMNNPLKYVDPTGEFCIGAAIFIGGFINFAIQGIMNNINSFGDCVKAWTIGGLAGLTGAACGGCGGCCGGGDKCEWISRRCGGGHSWRCSRRFCRRSRRGLAQRRVSRRWPETGPHRGRNRRPERRANRGCHRGN